MQPDRILSNPSVPSLLTVIALTIGFLVGCSHCPHLPTTITYKHTPVEYKDPTDRRAALDKALQTEYSVADKGHHVRAAAILIYCKPGMRAQWITASHVWDKLLEEHNLATYDTMLALYLRPGVKNNIGDKSWIPAMKYYGEDRRKADITVLISIQPLPQCNRTPAEFAKVPPRRGDVLWSIGSPKGLEGNISEGVLSAVIEHDDFIQYKADMAIAPGNSGGGLFNNRGQLVGIVTETILLYNRGMGFPHVMQQEGSSVATGLQTVLKFLHR